MKVLVARIGPIGEAIDDAEKARFRNAVRDIEIAFVDDREALTNQIADAEVVAGHLQPQDVEPAEKLRWFHSWSAGLDKEPLAELLVRGVTITSSKGNGAIPIAEHTIMSMLMLARNAVDWLDAQKRHHWKRHLSPELFGANLLLIGLGNIGMEIARRAAAFGMRTIAVRRNVKAPIPPFVDRVVAPEDMLSLIGLADFVVVAAPLTSSTKGMLRRSHFGAMKSSAFYICVSRGAIADDDALFECLSRRHIAGAALDAHAIEPLPRDSPFWDLPNVLITPHNAGTTAGTFRRSFDMFLENLKRYRSGLELRNVVDES